MPMRATTLLAIVTLAASFHGAYAQCDAGCTVIDFEGFGNTTEVAMVAGSPDVIFTASPPLTTWRTYVSKDAEGGSAYFRNAPSGVTAIKFDNNIDTVVSDPMVFSEPVRWVSLSYTVMSPTAPLTLTAKDSDGNVVATVIGRTDGNLGCPGDIFHCTWDTMTVVSGSANIASLVFSGTGSDTYFLDDITVCADEPLPVCGGVNTLDFEGFGNTTEVAMVAGSPDVIFTASPPLTAWRTYVSKDAEGGSAYFRNAPSGVTAIKFDNNIDTVVSDPMVFSEPVRWVSLSYTVKSPTAPLTLTAKDSDGNVVATVIGRTDGNLGCPGDIFHCTWDTMTVVSGSANIASLVFSGTGSDTYFLDDLTVCTEAPSLNHLPQAEAVVQTLVDIGDEATVRIDASGSFDPDESGPLSYEWTIDSGLTYQSAIVEIPLSFGPHQFELTVTDGLGACDTLTLDVCIDPAILALLELDKTKVEFDKTPPRLKIDGMIGLPLGVDYRDLSPMVWLDLDLAAQPLLNMATIPLNVSGGDDEKWELSIPVAGVTEFDIDWKGARFKFKEDGIPVELKTKMLTSLDTDLTIKIHDHEIDGPFTFSVDGTAMVEVDAEGNFFAVNPGVVIDEQKPGKEATVKLPVPLGEGTLIEFTGAVVSSFAVSEDQIETSVGRYRLELEFDAATFPEGSATTPRSLDLAVFLGAQMYPSPIQPGLDENDLEVKGDKWEAK